MQFTRHSPFARLTVAMALAAWLLTCGPLCLGMETAAQTAVQQSSRVAAGHAHLGSAAAVPLMHGAVHGGGHHPASGHEHGCSVKATAAGQSVKAAYRTFALTHDRPLLLYTVPVAAVCRLSAGGPSPPVPRLSPLAITSSLRI